MDSLELVGRVVIVLLILLCLLLVVCYLLCFLHEFKFKKTEESTKEKKLNSHYSKVVRETDDLLTGFASKALSDNVIYALERRIENALMVIAESNANSHNQLERLKRLKKKLDKYTVIHANQLDIDTASLLNLSEWAIPRVNKEIERVKFVLQKTKASTYLPEYVVQREVLRLKTVQVTLTVENLTVKAERAESLGNNGSAKEFLATALKVLCSDNIDGVYKAKVITQIDVIKARLDKELYKRPISAPSKEAKDEAEWDQIFGRGSKKYYPMYK